MAQETKNASGDETASTVAGGVARAFGTRQLLLVGGMLFSMFFGAGNLILPPLLGLQAGTDAPLAMAGFLLTAIGLPVLGIVAVALAGDLRALASRVHPLFADGFIILVYLCLGPFLAIPRTSSTAYEMLWPLLPGDVAPAGGVPDVAAILFTAVFFGIAFVLALHPGTLSRVLGKVGAPLLIVLIAALLGACLLNPPGYVTAAVPPYDAVAPVQGFLTGYQTMDMLAALCFGIIVAANVRQMGVTEPRRVTGAIMGAGVIAGVLMMLLYCGLAFSGAVMGSALPDATNGAAILSAVAHEAFGEAGSVVIAAIFLIACLNVCTGLVSCCAEYFNERFPRVPLVAWAAAFALFSAVVSLAGLDAIIAFSVPLLNALYPPAIVLVVLGLAHGWADRMPRVWPWTVGVVAVCSVAVALRDGFAPGLWLPFDMLPLADLGLGWLLPAVVGVAAGIVHSMAEKKGSAAPQPRG